MDEGRKSQKKTASSSPTEDSMEVVEKIRLLEERIEKIEGQLATGVPRSEKAKLIAVQQGFKAGHTVGFNLMRAYAKKLFPEGKWDDVDTVQAENAVGRLNS